MGDIYSQDIVILSRLKKKKHEMIVSILYNENYELI